MIALSLLQGGEEDTLVFYDLLMHAKALWLVGLAFTEYYTIVASSALARQEAASLVLRRWIGRAACLGMDVCCINI